MQVQYTTMNTWLSSIRRSSSGVACLYLTSIALVSIYYGTTPSPILNNYNIVALALAPTSVAFNVPMSAGRRTRTQTTRTLHQSHRLFASSNSLDGEEGEGTDTNNCGTGFHAEETNNGGKVCVYDYDTAADANVAADVASSAAVSAAVTAVVDVDEKALELQNKARRKFGLPNLTPNQFLALQQETKQIITKQIEDVATNVFREFDINGDGVVSTSELQTGLLKYFGTQYLNPNLVSNGDAIVTKVMEHFDVNGDGLLQKDEFVPIEELRTLLMEVIDSDGIETPITQPITSKYVQREEEAQQQLQQQQQQQQSSGGMFQSFFSTIFQDTCQSNDDCERPKVCCDFGYKKTCCMGGEGQLTPAMVYATIPSSTPKPPSNKGGDNVYDNKY